MVLLETDCNSYSNVALSKQMLLGGQVPATGNFVFIDSTLVMAINFVALAVRRHNSGSPNLHVNMSLGCTVRHTAEQHWSATSSQLQNSHLWERTL